MTFVLCSYHHDKIKCQPNGAHSFSAVLICHHLVVNRQNGGWGCSWSAHQLHVDFSKSLCERCKTKTSQVSTLITGQAFDTQTILDGGNKSLLFSLFFLYCQTDTELNSLFQALTHLRCLSSGNNSQVDHTILTLSSLVCRVFSHFSWGHSTCGALSCKRLRRHQNYSL